MYQALSEIQKQALLSGGKKDRPKDIENIDVISGNGAQNTDTFENNEVSIGLHVISL